MKKPGISKFVNFEMPGFFCLILIKPVLVQARKLGIKENSHDEYSRTVLRRMAASWGERMQSSLYIVNISYRLLWC